MQDNHSRSQRGAIRAFHFQLQPGQAKLVRAARGTVYDVAIDLRRDSPTYGQHEAFELSDENNRQLFVPVGFAHGFCVTERRRRRHLQGLELLRRAPPSAASRSTTPTLGVEWPVDEPLVSDRDRSNPRLSEIADELPW